MVIPQDAKSAQAIFFQGQQNRIQNNNTDNVYWYLIINLPPQL